MTSLDSFQELRDSLRNFAQPRGWDHFHSPKNLAAALSAQIGKVLEQFSWLSEEQSASLSLEARQAVTAEMMDALFYLVRLADKLDIDLYAAACDRLAANAQKHPVPVGRSDAA